MGAAGLAAAVTGAAVGVSGGTEQRLDGLDVAVAGGEGEVWEPVVVGAVHRHARG